jgi:hypothetical protein
MILIHLAEGNFAEALWEYERFRKLLIGQLGVEPSPDLAELVFVPAVEGRAVRPPSRTCTASNPSHRS